MMLNMVPVLAGVEIVRENFRLRKLFRRNMTRVNHTIYFSSFHVERRGTHIYQTYLGVLVAA